MEKPHGFREDAGAGGGLCLLLQAALHTLMIQASSFF
jgi:hypothetical protein